VAGASVGLARTFWVVVQCDSNAGGVPLSVVFAVAGGEGVLGGGKQSIICVRGCVSCELGEGPMG